MVFIGTLSLRAVDIKHAPFVFVVVKLADTLNFVDPGSGYFFFILSRFQ